MSDCRFGVSPVNYPDPDPDPDVILLRNTFCLQRGNVTSFRGYLWHPAILPEEDRFGHAE